MKSKYLLALAGIMLFSLFIVKNADAVTPDLKEGTYLRGQTLSVWPSWSSLGNAIGRSLPTDPINQLGIAGTCSTTTAKFCVNNDGCPAGEVCVLHDPVTGWSTIDRRFSFACAPLSYAYRYVASTSGRYEIRTRFEDEGLTVLNREAFREDFIDPSTIIITDQGICLMNEEISTMESGRCGDGRLNLDKGEQCDPPGFKNFDYSNCLAGGVGSMKQCGADCRWLVSVPANCSDAARCGNGKIEYPEQCDDGALNGRYNHCTANCSGRSGEFCGDRVVSSTYEVCDVALDDRYCVGGTRISLGCSTDMDCPDGSCQQPHTYSDGSLWALYKSKSCKWDCQGYGPYCGDRVTQEPYEQCDSNQSCEESGVRGARVCNTLCQKEGVDSAGNWVCNTAAVAPDPVDTVSAKCGDAKVDSDEVCDNGSRNGVACAPSYNESCSYCSRDCQHVIDVQPLQYCGNGTVEGTEVCDTDSAGAIYAKTYNATSTTSTPSNGGYKVLDCVKELQDPNTFKKGEKVCVDCKIIKLKTGEDGCVNCGLDMKNGVLVGGHVVNVLKLRNGFPFKESSSLPSIELIGDGSGTSDVVTAEKRNAPVNYLLNKPALSVSAKLNSNPICSSGEPRYKMRFEGDTSGGGAHYLDFTVIGDPQNSMPWRNDFAVSPVINQNIRSKDIRVVVSWVGNADFYAGFIKPSPDNRPIEGLTFNHKIASGTEYYSLGANQCVRWSCQGSSCGEFQPRCLEYIKTGYKWGGVWYHSMSTTPNNFNEESFTIDTSPGPGDDDQMSMNTYSFYVRTLGQPISPYRSSAKLKVEVYLPENDTDPFHIAKPIKTYYLNTSVGSDNPNAGYWQVFNVNQSGATSTVATVAENIVDINTVWSAPRYFKYAGDCTGRPVGYVCGASVGPCDAEEVCGSLSAFCPEDAFQPNTSTCRGASGDCDVADNCSGNSPYCPGDTVKDSGTVCRPEVVGTACDVEEICDGSTPNCPVDNFKNSSVECRGATGVCDNAEFCTGAQATCPVDGKKGSETQCRASSGVCDAEETCNGLNNDCPANSFERAGTVCRLSTENCDITETCTGSTATCPADAFAPVGMTCRAIAGVCDSAETCTGSSPSCPTDRFAASTVVCRASAGVCDGAENCSGSAAACPTNGFSPSGQTCNDTNTCTANDVCNGSGICSGTSLCTAANTVCQSGSCVCEAGYTMCGAVCVLNSRIGQACDDGFACTVNDRYVNACTCSGSITEPLCKVCRFDSDCNDNLVGTTDTCDVLHRVCNNRVVTTNLCLNACIDNNPYTNQACTRPNLIMYQCEYSQGQYW